MIKEIRKSIVKTFFKDFRLKIIYKNFIKRVKDIT
jgi:hypothetical protein